MSLKFVGPYTVILGNPNECDCKGETYMDSTLPEYWPSLDMCVQNFIKYEEEGKQYWGLHWKSQIGIFHILNVFKTR